jgi:hypothetical protein
LAASLGRNSNGSKHLELVRWSVVIIVSPTGFELKVNWLRNLRNRVTLLRVWTAADQ